ncbi:hypothetical protein Q428_05595 [Fervidicella metallireducens AeB]|uniref:Glutaredoxin domain-containing protein n=1 Tax=Fervidicella metallireducens AeB TaxID=1403537 RepID=A0A017RWW0_9CLOT|nr:glutaredoxin domain-containing protein [Fervidicella metallireducens]EYE88894.1 hypothetical protein Q428_05595 [Fervidicella metallireducens AeB]
MKYLLITSKGCNRCEIAKKLLEENGMEFKEVDAFSPEGIDAILTYNTNTNPAIIDTINKRVYSISEFREFIRLKNI